MDEEEVAIGMPVFVSNRAGNGEQTDPELDLQCIEDNIPPDMSTIVALDQVIYNSSHDDQWLVV